MTPPRPARLALALGLSLLPLAPARGQDEPLRAQGGAPGGLRSSVTEARGVLNFTVENPNPAGRDARVVVFYPGRPDEQYARDVWVPGRSILSAWVPVGPAAPQQATVGREVQFLLYDRTGGADRLVLPPGEERVRSRAVLYRRREPTTALFADETAEDTETDRPAPERPSPAARARLLTHAIRQTGKLPEAVSVVRDTFLPPTPDAFDGVDHVVLAGDSLAADPVGRAALRQWVQHGGRLWVLLDLVDPATAAPLLGDDFDFHVIDRVGLTTVRLHRAADDPATVPPRELEQPVDLVRVSLSGGERVLHTANGWPASFVRRLGRGKVLFTTLAAEGWHRPRVAGRDPRSPYSSVPDLPVPLTSLEELSTDLFQRDDRPALADDDLRPILTEEIGYEVPGVGTAGAVLGGFVLALVGLGVGLRRSRRPELVGWLGPAAAVAAAAAFVALGESGRRAVPPTAAVVGVVDAVPGTGEAAVRGLFAAYRPDSGPVPVGTTTGAVLDLDTEGLEGQTRRRVQTDTGAWRWDGLALPAGVRTGAFRDTLRGRLTAVGRFGPAGVEGRLTAPGFRDPADALMVTPAREPVALRLGPDGAFAAGGDDVLPAGQFLAGTVLTDRQQRRQAVYRELLTGPLPAHLDGRDLLLAWAEPADLPFAAGDGVRAVGTALLVVPAEFEPPPADTPVSIPRAFVPFRRVADGRLHQPTMDSAYPVDMRLRFQVPPSVLPLTVEKAVLHARVRAPSRRFAVAGIADGQSVPLLAVESPAEPIRLEITDARLLRLDERGGLHLSVQVTGGAESETAWKIESLGLDVTGRTAR